MQSQCGLIGVCERLVEAADSGARLEGEMCHKSNKDG